MSAEKPSQEITFSPMGDIEVSKKPLEQQQKKPKSLQVLPPPPIEDSKQEPTLLTKSQPTQPQPPPPGHMAPPTIEQPPPPGQVPLPVPTQPPPPSQVTTSVPSTSVIAQPPPPGQVASQTVTSLTQPPPSAKIATTISVEAQPPPPGQTAPTSQAPTQPPPPGLESRATEFLAQLQLLPKAALALQNSKANIPPQPSQIVEQSKASQLPNQPPKSIQPGLLTSTIPGVPSVLYSDKKKGPIPRRPTQPLFLLLHECSKEYITGYLTKKTEEDTTDLFSDRKKLHADLKLYCTEIVLSSARERILHELDEKGKEALKDITPETENLKAKFSESLILHKIFSDTLEDVKYQYTIAGENSESNQSALQPELLNIFRLWEQYNKKDITIANTVHTEQPRARGRGGYSRGGYWPPRGGGPPRHSPYPQQGPPRRRDWTGGIRDDREYRDRRPDDYHRDRREEYPRRDYDRRQDYRGPAGPPPFGRERPPIGRRDDQYHRAGGYEDRRRENNMYDRRPDDNRHPRDYRGPPPHPGPLVPPPKPSPAIYEAPPMPPNPPPTPHVQTSPQAGYDYQQYSTEQQQQQQQQQQYTAGPAAYQQDYNNQAYPGYYPQYPQEHQINGQANQQYQYQAAATTGWETQSAQMQAAQSHLTSFGWNQPGRHTAIPLPTDFMAGPSSAPRLSMPEPHEVLGVIKGVIIRDAQDTIAYGTVKSLEYELHWFNFFINWRYLSIVWKTMLVQLISVIFNNILTKSLWILYEIFKFEIIDY